MSIIIGGVFNSGILADPRPDATFNYSQAPADLLDRAKAIRDVCTEHGVTLPAAAMRFPQAHPAVTTVLMGARSTDEVAANLAAFDAEIPVATVDRPRRARAAARGRGRSADRRV